mmetsp:Transcript_8624/g.21541  ORF Transcript_8624/g.21541 Transcript_8624/m.21541 type:complete len:118 (-) Transcript_8624:1033-1386(-)
MPVYVSSCLELLVTACCVIVLSRGRGPSLGIFASGFRSRGPSVKAHSSTLVVISLCKSMHVGCACNPVFEGCLVLVESLHLLFFLSALAVDEVPFGVFQTCVVPVFDSSLEYWSESS